MPTTHSTSRLLAALALGFAATGCASTTPQAEAEVVIETSSGAVRNLVRLTSSVDAERNPVVSPDGQKVAFNVDKDGQLDIISIDTRTGLARTQITNHKSHDMHPAWMPDSERIVFSSNRLGRLGLWIQNASGRGGTTMITRSQDMMDFGPSVSPDGTTICFTSRGRAAIKEVGITEAGFRTYEVFEGALPHIWFVNTDGTNLTQFGKGIYPTWSPDGERIAYCSNSGGSWDIWLMDRDGSAMTQITSNDGNQIAPSFSPDGAWLAYISNLSGNFDLWVMRTDGTAATQLTIDSSEEGNPCWGADGNIYFCSRKTGNWDIWKLTPVLAQGLNPQPE